MKDKIITFLFIGYLFIFSIIHIILPDFEISVSERRKLATFPKFKLNNEYITKVDKYLLDHFPFRDDFRNLKAVYNYNVLNKIDNNGIYIKGNNIYKSNYPLDKKSVDNFINHINSMKSLLTENNNAYMMIIPDKNYYLEDKEFLNIDYDYIYNKLNEINIKNIDITNVLNKEDYYYTDAHFKQENLDKVIKKLSKEMNFKYENINYNEIKYNKFYGVYLKESSLSRNPETLTYLTNNVIESADVYYLENNKLNKVYDQDNLNNLDSYDIYLDGASSYIEITNNKSKTDRELVIFRDSFASSLSPLLINYYSKITLIDNRYINSDNFSKLIKFDNQDVLFMYSTLIVNNSYTLKN